MVAEDDGKLAKGGVLSALALILGIALAAICLYIAFEITYKGAGPDPDDTEAVITTTILVVGGIISGIVLVYMGGTAFWSPGLSGQEATGYSEVRRKRR